LTPAGPPDIYVKENNRIMPIGNTDVSISSIAAELQYSGADFQTKSTLFQSSTLAYSPNGGSYHNYNNMGTAANLSFATAIEARYSGSNNMGLGRWMYYNHDINVRLNIRVSNGNPFDDVEVRMWISDNPGAPSAYILVNQVVPRANTGNVILTDFDTGAPAFSAFSGSGGYWIYVEINNLTMSGFPCMMSVTASVDTDAVGGGTTRMNYTANGLPGGPWDLFTQGPFIGTLIAGDNGGGWPNDGISWNKRTTFLIDIT
jgi:hypothetical protein